MRWRGKGDETGMRAAVSCAGVPAAGQAERPASSAGHFPGEHWITE